MINIQKNKIKFSCKNLWKLFGEKTEEFLKNNIDVHCFLKAVAL